MCGLRGYECNCMCHGENGEQIAKHCVPCCERCPHCGKNITMGFLEDHIKESHPTSDSDSATATFMRHFE